MYSLEAHLRAIAKCDHAYVIALLDCCREKLRNRGLGQESEVLDTENLIIAFGCPPSRLTPAESTLAQDFFQFLEDSADANGYIALPGNLNFF